MKHIYDEQADLRTKYGATYDQDTWKVNLWHPVAQKVDMIIFDKDDQNKEVKRVAGKRVMPNFIWEFEEDLDGFFYQYEITQQDGQVTQAMDPFAKSMAAFNWEGKKEKVGKAAFIKVKKLKELYKLNKINNPQPIIYEAHVRDLTSLRKDVTIPGSFNALKEIDFGQHLNDLGITHLQLQPIHNCYALDETDKTILGKGEGKGWETNYNWGYDPHNYFSINGWYSSNPFNPYSRMEEFKDIVQYMHSKDIKVITDVVYNHMFSNSILDRLLPGYYFRDGASQNPVGEAPFASDRVMARRIIVESLKFFIEVYDVDGFRFDLSTFTDIATLEQIGDELREIKPNLVLHGEAWNWTDLDPMNSYNKETVDNDQDFAYFNDTTRNAIKGEDDGDGFALGLIGGNINEFAQYVSSMVGNIMDFYQDVPQISTARYDRFTETANNVLNYTACHDGHTMWDKINLTTQGDKIRKFEYMRQAVLLQQLLPGRTLYLEGSELLYTKPNDISGQDGDRSHKSDNAIDLFGLDTNDFNENTYRTTDYSNGIRWENLTPEVKGNIFDFIAAVNKFRTSTEFFNVSTTEEINKYYKFNNVEDKGIADMTININGKKVRIIHNFSEDDYQYTTDGEILFDSNIRELNTQNIIKSKSSVMIKEK